MEFVLSGCWGGVERVHGRRVFARMPVGSWSFGACGQNHKLLPDVIRSLQQLCLDFPGICKHTAEEGIRAQNMKHCQKEKATGDFVLCVKWVLLRLNMWVSETVWIVVLERSMNICVCSISVCTVCFILSHEVLARGEVKFWQKKTKKTEKTEKEANSKRCRNFFKKETFVKKKIKKLN